MKSLIIASTLLVLASTPVWAAYQLPPERLVSRDYNTKEPLGLKVKFIAKQALLFVPRYVKFVVVDDYGIKSGAYWALNCERYNIRCGRDWKFFSWGD